MIDFEEGLVSTILGSPLVDRYLEQRFFPGIAPQGTTGTYASYFLIGQQRGYFLRGRDGVPRLRYQIDVWSQDPDQARNAAAEIEELLDGHRGWLGGCFVKKLKAAVVGADDEPEDEASDVHWYRRRLEIEADIDQNRPARPISYQQTP